jgi:hypothetical protein
VPTELHSHFSRNIGHQTRPVANRVARALRLAGPTDDAYLGTLRSAGYQLADEGSVRSVDGNVTILAGRADPLTGSPAISISSTRWPVILRAVTWR